MKQLVGILAFFTLFSVEAGFAASASGVTVEKITIGEDRIATGRTQLIEVLIKNAGYKDISARVSLSLVLPNHNIVNFGNKRVTLSARSETRALFPYPIDKSRGGDYTVGAKVYALNGRVLALNTDKQKKYFFAVDPSRKNQKPKRPYKQVEKSEKEKQAEAAKTEVEKAAALFDPPDLAIDSMKIVNNNSILRGETAHVRLIVSNLGGDVATNSTMTVYWFFAPRENRKIKAYSQKIKVIAPGERKILDIPVTIPETEQKGEYHVYAAIDENNQVNELNENNNSATTEESIVFRDIALVFPEDNHSFAEEGLFKFEWRSRRYNQFKVQISADKLFSRHEEIFELPKGENEEGWTPNHHVKPLPGEMPSMALALMESVGTDHLYWRVKAKDSEGGTSESSARQFYITLKAVQP